MLSLGEIEFTSVGSPPPKTCKNACLYHVQQNLKPEWMKYHLYYWVKPDIFSEIISYFNFPCYQFAMSFITYQYFKVAFRAKQCQ